MLSLNTPIVYLKGVGPKNAKNLSKIGILEIKDLLFYFPKKYIDFKKIKKIAQIKIGEPVTIKAKITQLKTERSFKKKLFFTKALLSDESGSIPVIWFAKPYLENTLINGKEYFFSGIVKATKKGIIFIEPDFEDILKKNKLHTLRLVPIYKETSKITSKYLRHLLSQIIYLSKEIKETLPKYILEKYHLPSISKTIEFFHFPKNEKEIYSAKKRIKFENLLILELSLLKKKISIKNKKSQKIMFKKKELISFEKKLPFKLTSEQKKVLLEILKDMEKTSPMNRLLQGDVGSGKTIVALMVAINVAKNNLQTAFMAPTEILAWQHFHSALDFLKASDVTIALLTSSFSFLGWQNQVAKLNKKKLLKEIENGKIDIIFGTHSLIQNKIKFKNLSFVIVDEQHRFGINQRKNLAQKGQEAHILSMTATPIPRTLALSFYSDLDFSIIFKLPKKRKIFTKIVAKNSQNKAFEIIKKEIKKGSQAFIICPLIEDSEKMEVQSINQELKKIKKIFPKKWIGTIHGKLKASEKEKILNDFKKNKIKILISTSVIEVGIDIPRANLMIIESPERFGLAQLHQLRGRIGRGGETGFCFLFPEKLNKQIKQRLKAFKESDNGFELAQKDLEIRGPGEFLGTKQSGWPDYLMESILDLKFVKIARKEAIIILKNDQNLLKHPQIKERVSSFEKTISLE